MGIIASIIIVTLWRADSAPPPRREITTDEMIAVVNYFCHFDHATPYEREVLQATVEFLEGSKSEEEEILQG